MLFNLQYLYYFCVIGRTCAQVVENAHRTEVTALDFNKSAGWLVSGSADGTINVYSTANKSCTLKLSSTFDILHHLFSSYYITSLSLPVVAAQGVKGCDRVLVSTGSGDVFEARLTLPRLEADGEVVVIKFVIL